MKTEQKVALAIGGAVALSAAAAGIVLATAAGRKEEAPALTIYAGTGAVITIESTGSPTPQQIVSAVVQAAVDYPAVPVEVATAGGVFYIDTSSTVAAAAISGMSYADWLLLYGFGISGIDRGQKWLQPPQGRRLVGDNSGQGNWI